MLDGNVVIYGNVFDVCWKGVYYIDFMIMGDGFVYLEYVCFNYD